MLYTYMDGEYSLLNIDFNKRDKYIILHVNKMLSYKQSNNINKYLFPLLIKYKIDILELDMKNLKSIDHSGYNILYKLKWITKVNKSKLIFINVSSNITDELIKNNFKKNIKRKEVIV